MLSVGMTFDALLHLTRAWGLLGVNEILDSPCVFWLTPKAFVVSYEENMSACFVAFLFESWSGRGSFFWEGLGLLWAGVAAVL